MSVTNIITFLGGLALFLYGVLLMGDGIRLLAGSRLGDFIRNVTDSAPRALGVGAGMSSVIQSSSAVSIMAMGFVNTGLIRLRQAMYVVLGSLFGSCITGWIVSASHAGNSHLTTTLSASVIIGVLAVIGIYLRKFSKLQSRHVAGDILLGCAVLLAGMSSMTNSMQPLQNSPSFLSFLVQLSNPALGILIGIAFTALVQSSAAGIATLQALALTGSLTFSVTIPIMLGITIGGAVPVMISAIGLNTNSFRTALSHLLFDLFGAVICGAIFYIINAVHPFSFMNAPISIVEVALLNTILRAVMILLLSPMVGLVEKITIAVVREKTVAEESSAGDLDMLEERFLTHTTVAIAQSRRVVESMAHLVEKNLEDAASVLETYTDEKYKEVEETEALIDKYEDRLGSYLIKISRKPLSKQQNEDLYKFLHVITDLERMSDHALNLAESAQEIHEKEIVFSDEAQHELSVLRAAVREIISITLNAFVNDDLEAAFRVEPLEEHIDNLCDALKHNHIDRLQNETCTLEHGFVFNDMLTNFERIGDHCSNIAVAMLEINNDAFDTHEYVNSLVRMKDERFREYLEEYTQKYSL